MTKCNDKQSDKHSDKKNTMDLWTVGFRNKEGRKCSFCTDSYDLVDRTIKSFSKYGKVTISFQKADPKEFLFG